MIDLRHLIFITLVVASVFFTSCKEETSGRNVQMTFDKIEYVNSFPQEISLAKGETVDVDCVGILDVMACGDYFLVMKIGGQEAISVYSLSDFLYLGDYIGRGNGPGEVLYSIFSSRLNPILSSDGLSFKLEDGKGNMIDWNVTESVKAGETVVDVIYDNMPSGNFCSIPVNDTTYLRREIRADAKGQTRFLSENGNRRITSSMAKLNEASVPEDDGVSFNLVGSFTGYNKERDIVVEASMNLNTINMYTLDGSFEKTLCFGKKADDPTNVFKAGQSKQIRTFTHIQMCDRYFVVMYSGGKEYERVPLGLPKSKVYFIGYDGTPLVQINLPEKTETFTFDTESKILYTLNRDSEKIRKYDLSECSGL